MDRKGSGKTLFNRRHPIRTQPIPKEWRRCRKGRDLKRVMYDCYVTRGGGRLRHDALGDVEVREETMGHSVSTGNSAVKAAVLMDPGTLRLLFRAGRAEPGHIRLAEPDGTEIRDGKAVPRWRRDWIKDNWDACWHVRGSALLDVPGRGSRSYRYDFTVYRRADSMAQGRRVLVLYDLSMR